MRSISSQKGFTLIEIIVVITLVGVLATMGMVNYTKTLERGRRERARNNLISIHGACEIYRSKARVYPPSASPLTDINTALGLDMIDPDFNYQYTNAGAGFTATAARSGGPAYTLTVNNNPISTTNPSCSGSCP